VVTRATSDGRITLLSDRLMLRAAGQKSESVVSDQDEWHRLLNEYFSIELERKFC
jgi:arylamine N-acetyltransferase